MLEPPYTPRTYFNNNESKNNKISEEKMEISQEEEEESTDFKFDNENIEIIRRDLINLDPGCKLNRFQPETKMF